MEKAEAAAGALDKAHPLASLTPRRIYALAFQRGRLNLVGSLDGHPGYTVGPAPDFTTCSDTNAELHPLFLQEHPGLAYGEAEALRLLAAGATTCEAAHAI